MSCRIIAGSSGCGKSHQVYERIIRASLERPEEHFFVIVPEQFTLQTQKELLELHPRRTLMNIDVLSFQRLAYRIFDETGGGLQPILDDLGKTMILRKLIRENSRDLTVLQGTLARSGAVEEMKSLISELIQYRAEPAQVRQWAERTTSPTLERKLQDVSLLYQKFLEYLDRRYLTAEEVPEVLCRVIDNSNLLKGATVVLDGFTGFTPMQELVLGHLLKLCREVCLIVTAREGTPLLRPLPPHALFSMSSRMVRSLVRLAGEAGREVLPLEWISPGPGSRFAASPELAFLEQNLFRSGADPWPAVPENIHLTEAAAPGEEITCIAEEILRLVREQGYRYSDIAVVSGDRETYGREALRCFTAAGIPVFIDQKYPVMGNPLVEYVRAAIDMVRTGFSYASVFRFLRSGLGPLKRDEVDRLDNYVLAAGIRGWKQYAKAWTRLPVYLQQAEDGEEQLARLNVLREHLTEKLEPFVSGMRERMSTLQRKSEVLLALLEQEEIYLRLKKMEADFADRGQLTEAKEYAGIYALVLELIDKSVEALGEERIGLESWQQILDAGFQELRLRLIPPGNDQVLVGDIERTRLKNVRVLFFAGVNEGIVPAKAGRGGILSESDREQLLQQDAALSPSSREEIYQQRFYLYLLMTKPSEQLYISYSRSGGEADSRSPSYLIGMLRQMLPGLTVRRWEAGADLLPETEEVRLQMLLQGLRSVAHGETGEAWKELYAWYRKDPEGSRLLDRLLAAAATEKPEGSIGKAAAAALYGRELQGSVSRLETFAGCAFAHFLQYGLRLREREEQEFRSADLGNVIHEALRRFSVGLKLDRREWAGLQAAEREERIDRALEDSVSEYQDSFSFGEDGRGSWLLRRIRRMLHCTVWALQEQLEAGDFRPSDYEVSFESVIPLGPVARQEENESLRLKGRIDRIDLCREQDHLLVKVIDYKTGQKKLDLSAFYQGLQLQLVVYLKAVAEGKVAGRQHACDPAGIFYYKVDDPYVASELDTEEERLKALKPDGILREEAEILTHFDRELTAGVTSSVIPAGFTSKGSLQKNSPAYSAEDFVSLQRFADRKIREMGREILEGTTAVNPYQREKQKACDFCPYRSICGFDLRIPGYRWRQLQKTDNREMMEVIRKETYGD